MNRWKGDARNQVETSESVGGNAGSVDSSFGSTPSKRTKSDFKLRINQAPKTQFKTERLPTSTFKHSMSLNNEGGSSLDVQQDRNYHEKSIAGPGDTLLRGKQIIGLYNENHKEALFPEQFFDLHHIRETILKQEAVFRDQVRELHRVHKVQTLLLAEMAKKDCEVVSHSSGINLASHRQSAPEYVANSGKWSYPPDQLLKSSGQNYEASISLSEHLKGGSTIGVGDTDMSIPPQEAKLFAKNVRAPIRRTFDLERPPEDNDDDYDGQPDCMQDSYKPVQGIPFLELSASGNDERETDISLNLSFGWDRGKSGKDMAEQSDKSELDMSRTAKRPREREEAGSLPFLTAQQDSIQDVPLRPTPTVATQSFLGGLWGLQLGRIVDETPRTDGSSSLQESLVPVKKERHSLDLELNDKAMPATTSNGAPHWLLQVSAAKPPKNSVCRTESASPNMQESITPPKESTDHGMIKAFSSHWGGDCASGAGLGISSGGDQQVSGTLPWNQSQSSHNSRRAVEGDVQVGLRGAYQTPVFGATTTTGSGYGPFKLGQGIGETSHDVAAVYPFWGEGGDGSSNNLTHANFTPNHPHMGGFGIQPKVLQGTSGFGAQGVLQVRPAETATFVPDSGPGVWYHQRNPESQIQYYHQPPQLGPLHLGALTTPQQGPWQVPLPFPISQDAAYGQGPMYAIPAATGASIGFPVDGMRKNGEDHSEANWASNTGPPIPPFTIFTPPKAPFKRPPKLVLTHGSDGTTMELKLVSRERQFALNMVERSFSASSDDDGGENQEECVKGVLHNSYFQKERDMSVWPRGKWERDQRTYPLKENGGIASGGSVDWLVGKKISVTAHNKVQGGRNGVQTPANSIVPMTLQEGMDDADGGSSDAGSGGSGVGDVINPGDQTPPSAGTFTLGGSSRNLPAGEGEEGINMGEIGVQADSEAHSAKCTRMSAEEKCCRHQEIKQGQFSSPLTFGSTVSMIGKRLSQENIDGSGYGAEQTQKRMRGAPGLSQDVEERQPAFNVVVEQSSSSSAAGKKLLDIGNLSHSIYPARQNLKLSKNVPLELQQPTNSTSQPRIHTLVMQDSGSQGKESSILVESSECSVSDHGSKIAIEQHGGQLTVDIEGTGKPWTKQDMRTSKFSSFGNVCKQEREIKPGHSKQLPGASTSEKDVLHNPFSPGLRQVSSPSSKEDMERHAEGSSKKVSQASETVQGNGRSPLRTDEWNVPTAQGHYCSPGGIDSSCEEVDGTLVKRLQGGELEQKDSIQFCAVEGRQIFKPSEGRKMASIFVLG